jgi:hypothetical protein
MFQQWSCAKNPELESTNGSSMASAPGVKDKQSYNDVTLVAELQSQYMEQISKIQGTPDMWIADISAVIIYMFDDGNSLGRGPTSHRNASISNISVELIVRSLAALPFKYIKRCRHKNFPAQSGRPHLYDPQQSSTSASRQLIKHQRGSSNLIEIA